jgi:PAS domain S-box-containing protein
MSRTSPGSAFRSTSHAQGAQARLPSLRTYVRKMRQAIKLTGKEVFFDRDHFIVSKTDLKGRITYVNRAFCAVAGYGDNELLGAPHSIIRHPDMPRAVFKLLWDRLAEGHEVFAYVKNLTKNGDFYWVFAHVTPSYEGARRMVGFHSNRRVPNPRVIRETIVPLYAELKRVEDSFANAKQGLAASSTALHEVVSSKARSYDELVFSL